MADPPPSSRPHPTGSPQHTQHGRLPGSIGTKELLTSPVLSPRPLLCLRWLQCAAHIIVALLTVWTGSLYNGSPLTVTLSFVSFCLVGLYFLLAALHTHGHNTLYKQIVSYGLLLVPNPTLSGGGRATWLVFETVVPLHITVSVVFWLAVYDSTMQGWTEVLMNVPLPIIVELLCCRLPVLPSHLPCVLLAGGAYTGLLVVYQRNTGRWVYPFLDPALPSYSVWWWFVFVLLLAVAHGVGVMGCRYRDHCLGSRGPERVPLFTDSLNQPRNNSLSVGSEGDARVSVSISRGGSDFSEDTEIELTSTCFGACFPSP
jgi:hypothetical protein